MDPSVLRLKVDIGKLPSEYIVCTCLSRRKRKQYFVDNYNKLLSCMYSVSQKNETLYFTHSFAKY